LPLVAEWLWNFVSFLVQFFAVENELTLPGDYSSIFIYQISFTVNLATFFVKKFPLLLNKQVAIRIVTIKIT
jgi:hypothetical protein